MKWKDRKVDEMEEGNDNWGRGRDGGGGGAVEGGGVENEVRTIIMISQRSERKMLDTRFERHC